MGRGIKTSIFRPSAPAAICVTCHRVFPRSLYTLLRMHLVMARIAQRNQITVLKCQLRCILQMLDVMHCLRVSEASVPLALLAQVLVPSQDCGSLPLPSWRQIKRICFALVLHKQMKRAGSSPALNRVIHWIMEEPIRAGRFSPIHSSYPILRRYHHSRKLRMIS